MTARQLLPWNWPPRTARVVAIVALAIYGVACYSMWHPVVSKEARYRILGMNLFILALTLSSVYFVVRITLGRWLAGMAGIGFFLVATFPRVVLVGEERATDLYFQETTWLNPTAWWLVVFLAVAGLLGTLWYRRATGRWLPAWRQAKGHPQFARRATAMAILAGLTVVLHLLQVGHYTRKGQYYLGRGGEHRVMEIQFGGHHAITSDRGHHTGPAGLFISDRHDRLARRLFINDRPTGPYLFAILTPYANPYLVVRGINGLMGFFVVAGSFMLARRAGWGVAKSLAAALLVMTHPYFLHTVSLGGQFYFHAFGIQPLLIWALVHTGLLDRTRRPRHVTLYIALVCFLGLGYFPHIYTLFHLLCLLAVWLAGRARRQAGPASGLSPTEPSPARWKRWLALVALIVLPMLAKAAWVSVLEENNLLGRDDNRAIAASFSSNVVKLGRFALENPAQTLATLDENATRLVTNYIDSQAIQLLGVLGLVFVLFVGRRVAVDKAIPLYAMAAAFFILHLVAAMIGSLVWTQGRWSGPGIPLSWERACGGYTLIVFAQAIGLAAILRSLRVGLGALLKRNGSRRFEDVGTLVIACGLYLLQLGMVVHYWLRFSDRFGHPLLDWLAG